jgi:hypothetical protein
MGKEVEEKLFLIIYPGFWDSIKELGFVLQETGILALKFHTLSSLTSTG